MAIRPATPADAAAIAGLLPQLGSPRPAAGVAASLARGDEQVLVADSESGTVLGVAAMQVHRMLHLDHPVARLTVLVVDAEARRTGVGGLLLQEVAERARLAGCEGVELTSALRRKGAHEFYLRQGFANTSAKFWLPLT